MVRERLGESFKRLKPREIGKAAASYLFPTKLSSINFEQGQGSKSRSAAVSSPVICNHLGVAPGGKRQEEAPSST
jgi:hypothetical protein